LPIGPDPARNDELPAGFGPPAGFTLPGGPKVPGTRGDLRTTGTLALAIAATVLLVPVGIVALLLTLRARTANEHAQTDVARDKARLARIVAWIAIALGVVGWGLAVLRYARIAA
jgi:hypothetical protein